MAGAVPVSPKFQFSSTTGVPLSGGSVDVYLAGSTTRSNSWQDKALTTLNTNPIVLDSSGSCTIFTDASKTYKLVVKNSAGVTQSHLGGDNIPGAADFTATVTAATAGALSSANSASSDADRAEAARDASLLSRGIFATTAKALSKGVTSTASLVAGSGGTNGTFDVAFTGGAGSGAAARFVVAGGALTSITVTANGDSYTSAPTMSFAASSGLTGASATAVITNNSDSGEYFMVPSTNSYETLMLYQNVAGVATDTGKRIVNNSLSATYPDLEISLDALGNVYKRVDPEGQLYLGTDTTSIQQQIRDNRAGMVRFAGRALGAMAETYTNTDARDLVRVDAQALDTSWGAPAYTSKSIVQYGDATYMWRHPMMVKIARNQMLLFANKIFYNLTRGVGDIDGSTIQVCNITFDEAKKTFTQGAWRSIADYSAITGTFISGDGPPRAAATHMTACRLRSGANKGRIVMIFSTNKALPSSTVQQLPFFTYSDDSGQTWSTPVALTIGSIGSPGYIYSGNGRMIQLRYNSTYRNRILAAHYFDNGASNTFFASVYSDDGGTTWTRGSAGPTGTNETQYAEDIDGTVYAQSRADGTGSNVIYYYKSTDGGVTWSAVGGGTLAGNGSVQCSLVQCADEQTGVPRFFRGYSDPTTSPTTRERMTVALSYDAFTTAAVGTPLLLEGAPWFTAYSSIEMWNEQDALCVYESKPTQTAIAGTVGPGLKCASFNARSILG